MSTCIIPLQLLNSAPDIAVLDLGCKKSLETACEPSDIVSLRGLLKPISSVKWKRDSWHRHLFGRICAPSHTTSFEDWWISQLQESLANRTAPQANAPVDPTTDSCSTNGSQGLNGCDPDLFSSRTSKDFYPPKCQTVNSASPGQSRDWKAWVTQLRQEYSVRLKSAHLTRENESFCWPTTSARDWKDTPGMAQSATNKDGSHRNRTDQLARAVYNHGQAAPANHSTNGSRQGLSEENWITPQSRDVTGSTQAAVDMWAQGQRPKTSDQRLRTQVAAMEKRQKLWPTITAYTPDMESNGPNGHSGTYLAGAVKQEHKQWATPRAEHDSGRHRGQADTLHSQIKVWGTPTARDHKSGRGNEERVYKELTPMVERVQIGRLNPRWVETLMGVPVGWTMPSCSRPIADPANAAMMLSAGDVKNTTQTVHALGQIAVTTDNRTDELRLLGNGVVPATAEKAIRTLLNKHFNK